MVKSSSRSARCAVIVGVLLSWAQQLDGEIGDEAAASQVTPGFLWKALLYKGVSLSDVLNDHHKVAAE